MAWIEDLTAPILLGPERPHLAATGAVQVADERKQGNRGEPVSYTSAMSRWDPEPTCSCSQAGTRERIPALL